MSIRVPVEARTDSTFPRPLAGKLVVHRFRSRLLEGNPWGDPTERELPVYLPPSGETQGKPLLVLLSGYTGAGWFHFRRGLFLRESLLERLDRLIRHGLAAEAVMVGPDCLTSLGGSQYLNSPATGRYEDYVVQEIIPWIRETYGTGPTAVFGTSSGGYGSLLLATRHPETFQAVASDAGDMYFEYCYLPEFPPAARQIRKSGGPEKVLEQVLSRWTTEFVPSHPLLRALEAMGYASCYSPIESEPGRFDLPFDWETGELRPEVWQRWLAWDPVRWVDRPEYRAALKASKLVYLTAGRSDQYFLDVGLRVLSSKLRAYGVPHEVEEFEGDHSDGKTQYDVFIPKILSALGFPAASDRP